MSVRRRTVLVAAAAFLAAGTSVLAPGLTSASTPVAGGEDVSISFLTLFLLRLWGSRAQRREERST